MRKCFHFKQQEIPLPFFELLVALKRNTCPSSKAAYSYHNDLGLVESAHPVKQLNFTEDTCCNVCYTTRGIFNKIFEYKSFLRLSSLSCK